MSRNYVEIADKYRSEVLNGEKLACKYLQQACQRQKDDRDNPPAGYTWSDERASHICRFIEKLPHIKGKWARNKQNIQLSPAWVFILTTVFGWIDEKGCRRFKWAYIEVPRKNAKSTISAGVGLFGLCADDEMGAEIVSAATTKDQAKIVWIDAKKMVEKTPQMRDRFGVQTRAFSVFVDETASSFLPLSRDQGGNLDGLNVHLALVDELHAHKTRDVYDVLETATGARDQPLLWQITTAGSNLAGICYEQRRYVLSLLDRTVFDEQYFGIVYTVDPEMLADEERLLTDPRIWEMANPNWGLSVNPDDIARKAKKALELPSARPNFFTKHLNVWVNADQAWMDMIAWSRCGHSELNIEDFAGHVAHLGLDLASKVDIASLSALIETPDGPVLFTRHYVPEETAEESRNSQYSGWVRDAHLITTPGAVTDFEYIESDILDWCKLLDVEGIGYDPFQATYLATRLLQQDLPMVEYRHTVGKMSEPMKTLHADAVSSALRHDNNPCMNWQISNVVCHTDAKDNIYPRKEAFENKIDGPVSAIMARGMMLSSEQS
ncbi:MAG: terminase large subunit, partial [Geminicoccaceae bacterium]